MGALIIVIIGIDKVILCGTQQRHLLSYHLSPKVLIHCYMIKKYILDYSSIAV
jgi:hypothetical protein